LSPATTWTEKNQYATTYFEGIPAPGGGSVDAVLILLVAMPIGTGGLAFIDPTASWVEGSIGATGYAEKSQSATTWVEAT
jgi:hypothetical protein